MHFYSFIDVNKKDASFEQVIAKLNKLRFDFTVFNTCVVMDSPSDSALEAVQKILSADNIYTSDRFEASEKVQAIVIGYEKARKLAEQPGVRHLKHSPNRDLHQVAGRFIDIYNAMISMGECASMNGIYKTII